MRGVTRSDLQGSINVGDPVGIAIDEGVNRNLGLFAESANESAGRAGGDSRHIDENAIGGFPELVTLRSLENTSGFDGERELGAGFKTQMLDGSGNGIGATAEACAVNAFDLSGFQIGIEDHQIPSHSSAMLIGHKAQLL